MALRTIEAPGLQVNEIDRSQYNQTTETGLPNSPTCFIAGFADKGEDYAVHSIPTREEFEDKYGYPQNEAERYFYNGSLEVLKNGGKLLVAKLPYDNNSKDMYSYVDYKIDPTLHQIMTDYQIIGKWNTINDLSQVLDQTVMTIKILQGTGDLSTDIFDTEVPVELDTLPKMREAVNKIVNSNEFSILKQQFSHLDSEKNITLEEAFYTAGSLSSFYQVCILGNEDQNAREKLEKEFNAIITEIEANGFSLELTRKGDPPETFSVDAMTANDIDTFFNILRGVYAKEGHVTDAGDSILTLFQTYMHWSAETLAGKKFADLLRNVNLHTITQTVSALRENIQYIVNQVNAMYPYVDLKLNDSEITSYCSIVPDIDKNSGMARSGMIPTEKLDDYLTNNYTDIQNKIRIVDITRHQYEPTPFNTVRSVIEDNSVYGKKESYSIYTNECLGIVPVIVTPANALYFQCLLNDASGRDYNVVANFNSTMTTNPNVHVELTKNAVLSNLYIDLKNSNTDSPTKETLSKMVADCFPQIERANYLHFDKEHFKKIGVVVLSSFIDNANNMKLNFKVLESFVGSLDKDTRSITDNSDIFIDHIVNSNSKYIRFFSAANTRTVRESSILAINNQTATSLGFYKLDCEKKIDAQKSIMTPLKIVLDNMIDTRGWQVDLVLDAGLTNIGQYLEGTNATYSSLLSLNDRPKRWWAIANIYDNFCKFTRKDCMFLLDSPRPFCLEGDQKIVRRTKPTNTILYNIVPKLKYMTGINSSYSAGYCNWFKVVDQFSGDVFWCPPSIKVASVYIYSDVYYHKWSAPAGMNRGKVTDVLDVAFSPTNSEAGRLYTQCWNYAVSYPHDGIIVEGQRTFQRKATALDRVNVRKLMLHLEKSVVNIAKFFLYEGHTSYLRERFVNAITPIFEDAVNGYGISDYIIKCDEDNNPTTAIDRNELHCSIAVKPVKAVEFIVLNFIVTNQTASVQEEVAKV